ncbi:small integral membrane protein 29-like [Biomphalaria glabrata]|uniref:Small integral membrane protein 29-like n=1 Tax=Biomphalaria glabrata TaxID=6526 RepID=A0A9W3A5J7_BIOGL|nr:small integral membrane protein 29-like [Biomphalaria glabrata]
MSWRDTQMTESYLNTTETVLAVNQEHDGSSNSNVLLIILLPITALICVAVVIGVIVWMLKRSRMDKLRHHLMPLYSFEPSDSSQDWETDLLTQEIRLRNSTSPPSSPILKLNTMHSEL